MAQRIPFRNRAHEVSRIEAFSDVIFGFAVSLLVVSLEAPKSFEELMEMMHGFIPFAIAFFLLIDLWFEHHEFFRRYALHDRTITTLNTLLLFVILFYVYPLKFVFVASVETILRRKNVITVEQAPTLFLVYGAGFTAVFLIFGFMYRHAWKQRVALQLNLVEEIDTLESVHDNFASSAFGLLSALLGFILPRNVVGLAGYVYFLIFIPKAVIPARMRRKRRAAEEDMLASAPQTPG